MGATEPGPGRAGGDRAGLEGRDYPGSGDTGPAVGGVSGPEAGYSPPGTNRPPRTHRPRDPPGEGSDDDSETPAPSVTHSEEEEEEEGHQWRVGDACVAPWAGDGLLYPARLRALAASTCLVEFEGYGNTQEQALADLLPPHPGAWGASDTPGGQGPPSSREPPAGARRRRRRKGERASCSPRRPEVPPAPREEEEEEEEEALAAMLLAWYMSGYHTGFYVGLREGRAEAAEPPPRPRCGRKKPPSG
ncbi:uncharacterized protein O9250_012505 [Rhynochetos jubatus]